MRLAMRQASTLYYLLPDLLGSPTVALTSSGSFQAVQLFNPYGTSRYSSGNMPTDYNFTGQRLDSETGLIYENFRYYDPVSGRFTRADTVDTNASGMDGYAYVMDSPESKKDPSGHSGSLGDDAAQQFVEEWYMQIEGTNGILIDQPSSTHNPDMAIRNAELESWNGSSVGLRKLISGMPGDIANGGTSGNNGYPDIMNENLNLIYEVKGGSSLPDGSTTFPNPLTIAYGWAQVRWYAAMANQDPDWNQGKPWTVGNLRDDTLLANVLQNCGGICIQQMSDGRWIAIMYAGYGVLTYQVFNQKPTNLKPATIQQGFANNYNNWKNLILRILIMGAVGAAAAGIAGLPVNPGNDNVDTGGFDSPGVGWVGPGAGCSFTPDTVVLTPDGEQAIGQLQVGEQVVAYNVQGHITEAQPIMHIWVHDDDDLVDLTIMPVSQPFVLAVRLKSELVHTTSKHPFLTEEDGFVPAGQLLVGMHVLQADGSVGVITMIQRVPGNRMMYNLEVAHDHTFMVGEGQWIVHNGCF